MLNSNTSTLQSSVNLFFCVKRICSFIIVILLLFQQAHAQFQFVSPEPGSQNLNIEHNIILREGNLLDPSSLNKNLFTIRGTKSGVHDFKMVLCDDGKTINLNPLLPFAPGEEVTISITKGLATAQGKTVDGYSYSFKTHRQYTAEDLQRFHEAKNIFRQEELDGNGVNNGSDTSGTREVTGEFTIEVNTAPSPGDIFFDSWSGNYDLSKYDSYQIITPNGDSVYGGPQSFYYQDFKLNGNGYLTVCNAAYGRYDVIDSSYHIIDKFYPANGYEIDDHEFQMLPDGPALIIVNEYQTVDMTVYDPTYSPNATVVGGVIQEFDADHNLIFEWRAFDHVEITEALHLHLNAGFIDYTHTNSIEVDTDGNLIVSQRHLDQVCKIDINTGEFIWRLGGIKGDITFLNEPEPFTYQHDARRIANGNITLWDNGNYHTPHYSAAKEYTVDEINKTATLVWSYTPLVPDGSPVYFFAMGSVQRLANGNTFINGGWESNTTYSNMWEINTANEVVWELKLTDAKSIVSYRARKFEWNPCARVSYHHMRSGNITSTSAKLQWLPATNAEEYKLQFRKIGDPTWSKKTISAPLVSKVISDLQPSTKYEWRMQTGCSGISDTASGYTSSKVFKTLPAKFQSSTGESDVLTIFPNPAHDVITILSNQSISQVRIMNLLGQEVRGFVLKEEDASLAVQLSLNNLSPGNYFVALTCGERTDLRKIVVD